ncbi:MAG: tRNA (N6-threonylcarbamoyladenosine(37)-N6)-methyltransferase TrmO [Candidatus Caldarchaeum sp.]|jgi:tRNA-Thr(GGU) m(6)t(6)A37 methyltransferase TsaA
MITLKPIGVVVEGMPAEKNVEWSRWRNPSYIEVYQEYRDGLRGLGEYSHVYVIYYMHLEKRVQLVIRPRGRADMPEVGVFAFRGPTRPNPIGLTLCRLVEVTTNGLRVLGLDAFTGTPVLDIKPYDYYDIVEKPRVPEWFIRLWSENHSSGHPMP